MAEPFFSVCIPCYNARRFLAATLDSLGTQRYPLWELIVVEDGSREPVADLVDAFRSVVTQPVRYLVHPQNRGLPAARDTAFAAARGTHVAPLDADDLWLPDHLATLAAAIAAHDADITFGGFEMFDDGTDHVRGTFLPSEADLSAFALNLFTQRFWVIPSAVAIRRELFTRTGSWSAAMERRSRLLSPPPSRGEDYNFWLRALHAGATWRCTGARTLRYRWHAESMSKKRNDSIVYHALLYNLYGPVPGVPRKPQAEFISRLNTNAAKLLCRFGDRRAAYLLWWAWSWRPTRVANLLLLPATALAPGLVARLLGGRS